MQTDKEDLIIIALPQIRDISRLERDDALYGEDIGGVDVIPPGRILHILVGRLDEAVRRNGEAVRAFQNHFPVMPGPRFRQRVGIRLAHGEAYAKEVFRDNTISVSVPTTELREEILRSKTGMLMRIAELAGIEGMIELEVIVNEEIRAVRPIKLEDRVRYITEKNPLVAELRKALDLEVE